MKKSISIVLVLAMLLTMLPLTVFSEESNDVTYTINMTFPTEVENGSTVAVGIAFFDIDAPEADSSKPYVGRRLIFVKGETESITYTINKNMTWIMEGTYGNYYGLVNDEENYQRETDPNTAPSPVHLGNVDATNKVIELSIDTENCMAPGTYQMPEPPFTGKIADVIMNFPDSVPDGSYVDIALAYADKNKYEAWGGYWPEYAGQVLHFVKGETTKLELKLPQGNSKFLADGAHTWAIVNDYAAYEALIPGEGQTFYNLKDAGAKWVSTVSFVSPEESQSGRDEFTLTVGEGSVMHTVTVNVNFPDNVPNGTKISLACAYADGKINAGDTWNCCKDKVLVFEKGKTESLEYSGLPGGDMTASWIKWAVVNDLEGYRNTPAGEGINNHFLINKSSSSKAEDGHQTLEFSPNVSQCVQPLSFTTTMKFPDSVPNGTKISIACYYADSASVSTPSDTAWDGCKRQVLTFVKGETETLEYTGIPSGDISWVSWAVVNDLEGYWAAIKSGDTDTLNSKYVNKIGITKDKVGDQQIFNFSTDAYHCVLPPEPETQPETKPETQPETKPETQPEETRDPYLTVNMVFPDNVPNGTKISIACAFADGKCDPERGSGDSSWDGCKGQVLTFEKGKTETLEYTGIPNNDIDWVQWAVVNDLEGYQNTAWDDAAIAHYLCISKSSFDTAPNGHLTLTFKPDASKCVPPYKFVTTMNFPADVPIGTKISLSCYYADKAMFNEEGNPDTAWDGCKRQVLTFEKGKTETLEYTGLPSASEIGWVNWAVVNDLEGYWAAVNAGASAENYLGKVTAVYAYNKETGVQSFDFTCKRENCIVAKKDVTVTVVFPNDVPNGATIALANAFVDGKQNPKDGSGGPEWDSLKGQILTFVKGADETLKFTGFEKALNGITWLFAASNFGIANDATGYAAAKWDDANIGNFLGTGKLTVSDLAVDKDGNGSLTVTITDKRVCVYEAPETTPETKPETQPETQPETKPETQPETKPETQPETKPETQPETQPEPEFVEPESFAAVVHVEINPSFDLYLDALGNVLAVHALNEDAKSIVDEIPFVGLQVTEVVNNIVEESNASGFLTEQNSTIHVEVAAVKGAQIEVDTVVQTIVQAVETKVTTMDLGFQVKQEVKASESYYVPVAERTAPKYSKETIIVATTIAIVAVVVVVYNLYFAELINNLF